MTITIPDPALVLLIGPAGAGKSTFAAAYFKPVEIVSSDHLRGLLANDPADQSASADAFRILTLMVAGRMKRHLTTVVDATSLRAANRRKYRELAARNGVPVVAIAFDLSAATYHARNRGRAGRAVADDVVERHIDGMARTMAALPGEGYSALYVIREDDQVAVERG
ncbi:MAG TPA: AAA family ATPase [Candidatus Limnocylindria bacterium]|nr:AAA family ATPase [Candidatus Limnocylindria bacterium]